MSKTVFISYKWGNDAHNAWVERFATVLRLRGINALLDKFEVSPGASFSDYMTKGIRGADHVLFIVTSDAVNAVESGGGALAFEMQIANAKRLIGKGEFSIVPILREGDYSSTYLSDHRYIDFRSDDDFAKSVSELVKWLSGETKAPPVGFDVDDPKSISEALPYLEETQVLGWRHGVDPDEGQEGEIRLLKGLLKYRRQSSDNRWDGPWHKDHFAWELKWAEDTGVTVKSRWRVSPD